MSYDSEVAADTPRVWWKLDETTGTAVADSSGNVKPGTNNGTPSWGQPPLVTGGLTAVKPGTSDVAVISNDNGAYYATATFAVEAWFEIEPGTNFFGGRFGIAAVQANAGGLNRWALVARPAATEIDVVLDTTLDVLTFTQTFVEGETYHVVAEYDGTDVKVYVNGTSLGAHAFTYGAAVNPRFRVAEYVAGSWSNDPGVIFQHFALYNAVLGATRVTAHYDAGLIGPSSPVQPVLRQAIPYGPRSTFDGEVVSDIVAKLTTISTAMSGAPIVATLNDTLSRQWVDPLNETGSGQFTIQNDDPDLALIIGDGNDLVRFYYKGYAAFTMICEAYEATIIAQGEEADEATVWSGRGHLALLERALVYPARGVTNEDTWYLADFDDTFWPVATVVLANAGGTVPSFPSATADWIWGIPGDTTYAPPGECWFRVSFNLAAPEAIDFYFSTDDFGTAYLDGVELIDLPQPPTGFAFFTGINNVSLAAGDHVLAVKVVNRFDGRPPPGNPGGLIAAVRNSANAFIVESDATWKVRAYPAHVAVYPIEEDRTFTWSSLGFDDSGWGPAVEITTVGVAKISWPIPWSTEFPDDTARVLWGNGSSIIDAPQGNCYFRKTFTVASPGKYLIYACADNGASIYIDGGLLLNIAGGGTYNDLGAFTKVHTESVLLDAGEHLIAVSGFNYFDVGGPGLNPGGIAIAVYSTDIDGSTALALMLHTDASWLMVDYPVIPPGMTPGQVMRIVIEEFQARGVLPGLVLHCTDGADSAGNPWTVVADIATKVGTDVLTFFREMSGTYVDFWMAPGGLDLYAWIKDKRGRASGVVLTGATNPTDPDSGNLTALIFKGST